MREMFLIRVPILVAITGEGGSGGALGIGIGDRILMLEHAIYSVIPPEGCAAILWKDAQRGADAAQALRLTAQDARGFGVVDEIIPEPLGGAHANHEQTATAVQEALNKHLEELRRLKPDKLIRRRREKFLRMGKFDE